MQTKTLKIENGGVRLDVFVSEVSYETRSRIKKRIESGEITVNGQVSKAGRILKAGDNVQLDFAKPEPVKTKPVDIPLEIIYEDEYLAVVNKPQGMTVHAGNGTGEDTLVNALLYRIKNLSGIGGVLRPGIVHRIDKNTSGLLVVAKNDQAHVCLSRQISEKTCSRKYYALLEGVVKQDEGRIETFIGRNKNDRTKMAVLTSGRKAITEYKVIKRYAEYTFCEFSLKTGRTHQIRVHAKHIAHPVVGDKEYGYARQKFKLNGQLLHAYSLSFEHPKSGELMNFTADLPDYFQNILRIIG